MEEDGRVSGLQVEVAIGDHESVWAKASFAIPSRI